MWIFFQVVVTLKLPHTEVFALKCQFQISWLTLCVCVCVFLKEMHFQ